MSRFQILVAAALLLLSSGRLDAQTQNDEPFAAGGLPAVPLPDTPAVYPTAEGVDIRVSVVTSGLTYPWGLALLPDGDILVTERLGALRVIRNGVLDPTPIAGVPDVHLGTALAGLMDVALHPDSGLLWASEHAPMGGDEVNVVLPGRNYGWPVVSYSREYYGPRISEQPWRAFSTGDRFPAWRGDLFVGSLMTGRIERTGHLERITFNRQGLEQRREWLLADVRQRIRDVEQSPDGLIYVLTAGSFLGVDPERGTAALLRIEPVE